jgi:predicted amidophosphoribosyltransferase
MADPGMAVCGDCVRDLNQSPVLRGEPPEGVDRIASCADHDGVARELLAAFKFRHLTGLAPLIAGFMADAAGLSTGDGPILVPVPPARLRTWLRGFDPVALLAVEVARLTGITLPAEPLLIRRGSRRQRGRGRAGRLAAPPTISPLEDAGRLIGGREVLLVDDVMTTGATLATAAGALRKSGAIGVTALTFTRRL